MNGINSVDIQSYHYSKIIHIFQYFFPVGNFSHGKFFPFCQMGIFSRGTFFPREKIPMGFFKNGFSCTNVM